MISSVFLASLAGATPHRYVVMSRSILPDKLFFRIGEVAEIVGVKPHVLRYWEEELGVLRPMKTRGSHRQYRRRDVEIAIVVKRLLHEEGFTLAGAKKKLREMGMADALRDGGRGEGRGAARELEMRAELLALREELVAIRDGLGERVSMVGARAATVTADEDVHEHVTEPVRAGARREGRT